MLRPMTAQERVALVRRKLARAEKHFSDLKSELKAFFDSIPYTVGNRQDPTTQRRVYFAESVKETPAQLAEITGDVLQNLRSTLDHLAWQLVETAGGSRRKQTAFPISENAANY